MPHPGRNQPHGPGTGALAAAAPRSCAELETAQIYYEDGRVAVVHGLRLDEWPVLDHLPDPLVAWIHDRIRERRNQ